MNIVETVKNHVIERYNQRGKLESSFNKMIPQAQKIVRDGYLVAMKILEE